VGDRRLAHPDIEYTHAMDVRPVIRPAPAAAMAVVTALPLAA